jgi:hypothetical protein
MFKRLISLTIILSMVSIDFVRAMEPDDERRNSLPIHRAQQQQLLQRQQELGDEERRWQRALETLKGQKSDLDRRQEALAREEAKVREDLERVNRQKPTLQQEKQKLEKEERQWQEKREREHAQLKQEEEDHQRRVDEARRKQAEDDRIHSQESAKKSEAFQEQQLKLIENQRTAQEALQKLEALEQKLQEEQVRVVQLKIEEDAPADAEEEKQRQLQGLQKQQEELKGEKERAQEALKRVLEEQTQLRRDQEGAEGEERQWQAQRREKERQIGEEAAARLQRLSDDRRMGEEEDSRFKQTLEAQKEALQRQEQSLCETERRAQEERGNLSLRQEVLEGERGKWAADIRSVQDKLDACHREQEETSSVLSSSPLSTLSSGLSRTTSSPLSSSPSSSPEKETSLLDKRPKKKSPPPSGEKTPLLKGQVSIQGDTSLKDFGALGGDFVNVDFEKGGENDQLDLAAIVQKVRGLNPEDPVDRGVLAFLSYAKDYINDGKFTWRQILLGGIGGTLIGVGVGNAMPPIFSGGLVQISPEAAWTNTATILFITHTAVTLGIDSISRNVMIIGDLAGPSRDRFSLPRQKIKYGKIELDQRMLSSVFVYLGASMAALLPVYYLWSAEKGDISDDPKYRKADIIFIECLAPPLFLDALFTNARAMQEWVDKKLNIRRVHQGFGEEKLLSPARVLRQQELKRFDDLIRIFRSTPDENIHDLYEQVLSNGLNIQKNGTDKPEEILKDADTLQTLKALRKIHGTYQIPPENEKAWKRKVAKVLGWGIPGLATVARTLVFYAIIHELLGDLGENGIGNEVLSGVFGGAIASLFLGKVEVEAVEEGVYQLLHGKDLESDASKSWIWKGLRKIGKTYDFAQGAWNTLPYVLVGIAATNGWPVAVQVATLLFFGIADAFNNTLAFHESYGGVVNGVESLGSYTGRMTPGYKRNKLIKIAGHYKKVYEIMAPEVMSKFDSLLSPHDEELLE